MTASGMAEAPSTPGSARPISRGPDPPLPSPLMCSRSQPLQPLSLVTELAPRIKAASVLQVVPGAEMATGSPGAKRFVSGVGGDEGGCLERRAGIEVIRERARINTAVGVLVKQPHNRPFGLAHNMRSSIKRQPGQAGWQLSAPAGAPARDTHRRRAGHARRGWPERCPL